MTHSLAADTTLASPFAIADFRRQLFAVACSTLASRGVAAVVNYEVYQLTKSEFSLGIVGLVEAIPALSLALYGGHIADRHDRRRILQITLGGSAIAAVLFAGFAISAMSRQEWWMLIALYAVAFATGTARGFAEPAMSALEAQIVPRSLMVKASAWLSVTWLSCSIIGPAVCGLILAHGGAVVAFEIFAVLFGCSWAFVSRMSAYPIPPPTEGESLWQSVAEGVKYVTRDQVMLGSMSLDLFAVLFGGAIALLPKFAEILEVGPEAYGLLVAAPNCGALATMLYCVKRPPIRHAGRNLLVAVAGFGVAMIVFALSQNFLLSIVMLFIAGMCDGVSVVIRRSIVRLMTPPRLRGRVASVSMVFIGASNELGALESGLAAAAIGTVRSVWIGAVVTLGVVSFTAWRAPKLRALRLDDVLPPEEPRLFEKPADTA